MVSNDIQICEAIESDLPKWKSQQHRLTPKYYILSLFVTLVKYYQMICVDDNYKPFKITFQRFKRCVIGTGKSVELLYTDFIYEAISTLILYPEELINEFILLVACRD